MRVHTAKQTHLMRVHTSGTHLSAEARQISCPAQHIDSILKEPWIELSFSMSICRLLCFVTDFAQWKTCYLSGMGVVSDSVR